MKAIKMLVVAGMIAGMGAYAQDGGKQQAPATKKAESQPKETKEHVIKQKSSAVRNEHKNAAGKEAKPAEAQQHQEKKANNPK